MWKEVARGWWSVFRANKNSKNKTLKMEEAKNQLKGGMVSPCKMLWKYPVIFQKIADG
jgi:hypothetical protein